MAVFIVCPSGGEYTGVDLRNGQLQENLRHQDTLCVSVLTLSTIMVGGLFAFFRFPALPGTWGLNPGTVTTVPVVLGMVVAVVLYAMCIWRGMRILANNNLFGEDTGISKFARPRDRAGRDGFHCCLGDVLYSPAIRPYDGTNLWLAAAVLTG